MKGDRALVGSHHMLAALQCPAAEGGRRLTVRRIGKGGLGNDVSAGLLDDRLVECFRAAARQSCECPLDGRQSRQLRSV
ncbi:hypothetical protein D3C78_1692840 [compost metagenome]